MLTKDYILFHRCSTVRIRTDFWRCLPIYFDFQLDLKQVSLCVCVFLIIPADANVLPKSTYV